MALTDPIFKLQIDPRASNISPIEYIEQTDIGREMKIPVSLVAGSPQTIDLTKVGTLYRIIFIPKFEDKGPSATKLTLKVFKLPSPEKEITLEFLNLFVWDVPPDWSSSLKNVSLSTDSEEEYSVDVRIWGR